MLDEYLRAKAIRSKRTAEVYANHLSLWARSRGFTNADDALNDMRSKKLDPYTVLQEQVSALNDKHLSPSTILSHYSALKGFMLHSDVELSTDKCKQKVVLPAHYETSSDRAPTAEEVRRLLRYSALSTQTAITIMASSGMRVGEMTSLKVSNITFGMKGQPSKIELKAVQTKTRKRRLTFISTEATELLKEHLGDKIKDLSAKLFEESADAIYGKVMRALIKAGLRNKEDSESARYALHVHCFRKYFFSNLLAAGVDRGLTEGFMGHAFGLDSSYLRMTDEQLESEYIKAHDRLVFLSTPNGNHMRTRVQELEEESRKKDEQLAKQAKQLARMTRLVQTMAEESHSPKVREESRKIKREEKEGAD